MRRSDRLFELILLFRGGRLWRGQDLADELEVSLRTVYRDIETLVASGIPIEGARGLGFLLRAPIFLPPMTLSARELEALNLGTELVSKSGDPELAAAAARLRRKIDTVLPAERQGQETVPGVAIHTREEEAPLALLPDLRRAIRASRVLEIGYRSLGDVTSRRRIRPLNLEYWGRVWTCTAWCELRDDFRVFRVDRIDGCRDTGELFSQVAGQSYGDYLARFDSDAPRC